MPLMSNAARQYSFIYGFSHSDIVHSSKARESLYPAEVTRGKLNREGNSKGKNVHQLHGSRAPPLPNRY